jgi:hypothetical protein
MNGVLLLLLGCGGVAEDRVVEEPPPIVRRVVVQPVKQRADEVSTHHSVDVSLSFMGISSLHRGFFLRSAGVQRLGQTLGACLDQPATVEVGYSNEDLKGRILLVTTQERGSCQPILTSSGLDLAPWIPIGRALAQYRNHVAGTSDFRISNFSVGIRIERPDGSCVWTIDGQHPPDGTLWSPCLRTESGEICAKEGQPSVQLTWRSKSDEAVARACFAGS